MSEQKKSIVRRVLRAAVYTFLGLFILAMVIGILVSNDGTSRSVPEVPERTVTTGNDNESRGFLSSILPEPTITKAEYDALKTGMTYRQAVTVIGEMGEELSRNEIAGFVTVMYQWPNTDGSNMNAMFQNDGLIQKAQFGLK